MRRLNKKTLLVLGVGCLALLSVLAAVLVYVLDKGRRQRVLLASAESYMAQGDASRAVLQYKRAISLGNASADAFYRYGLCLEKLEQPQAAFRAFEQAVTRDPTLFDAWLRVAEVYLVQAQAAVARGDADPQTLKPLRQLADAARTCIRLRPRSREGYVALARAEQLRGDADAALAAADQGVEQLPDDLPLKAERIRLLLRLKRTDDAAKSLESDLALHPDSTDLLMARAVLAQTLRQPDEEMKALTRVIEMDPKHIEARGQIALLHFRAQRYDAAEAEFVKACELQPERPDLWMSLARFYSATDRAVKAAETLERISAQRPNDLALLIELARARMDAGLTREAHATLEALEKQRAAPHVLAWLEGHLALAEGQPALGKAKFLEAIRKANGDFAEAHWGLALCYKAEGNFGAAEEQFNLAAHFQPMRLRAWLALADLYLVESRPDLTLAKCSEIQTLQARLSGAPDGALAQDPSVLTLIGRAQLQQTDFDDAEKTFQAALAASVRPAQRAAALGWLARTQLAIALQSRQQGDAAARERALAAAEAYRAQAEQADPKEASLSFIAAQLAAQRGETRKADELAKTAAASPDASARLIRERVALDAAEAGVTEQLVAAHPDHPAVLASASDYFSALSQMEQQKAQRAPDQREALLAASREHLDRAILYARKAFDLDPTNSVNGVRVFQLLRSTRRMDDANAIVSAILKSSVTEPLGQALSAWVLWDEGKRDDAVQRMKKSIQTNEKDWLTHFWLGQMYAQMPGRAPEAEVELGRAGALRPTSAEVTTLLLSVLESQGKYDRIQSELDAVLARSPNDLAALMRSARLHEKTGNLDKSAAAWRRVTEIAPSRAAGFIEYARLLQRIGKTADAVAAAQKAAALEKGGAASLRSLIQAHLANRDRAAAEAVVRDALESRPDDPSIHLIAGALYQAIGEPAQAEADLKRHASAHPDDAVAHILLGDFYMGQQRFGDAVQAYGEALRIQPNLAGAEFGRIKALLAQARAAESPAAAEDILRRVEERIAAIRAKDSRSVHALLAEADVLVLRGKLDDAESILNGLAQDPATPTQVLLSLAQLHVQRGKPDAAEEPLRSVLAREPQSSEAHVLLAQIQAGRNRLKDSLAACQEALTYQPANAAALALRAQVLQQIGRGSEALADLQMLCRLQPRDRLALFRLIQALLAQKAEKEALQAAREAAGRNPESAEFLEEYVRVLRWMKQYAEAETVLRLFMGSHGATEGVHVLLAQVQLEAGRPAEAEQSLAAAEQLASDPPVFLRRASAICLRAGATEAALRFARRLAEAQPEDVSAQAALVEALRAAQRDDEALQTAESAFKTHADSPAFLQLLIAQRTARKQWDAALRDLDDYLARHPDQAGVHWLKADTLSAAGRADAAFAALQKAEALMGAGASPDLLARLSRSYTALKRYPEAERTAQRVCERTPASPQAWLNYAMVLEAQGERARAVPLYRKALGLPAIPRDLRLILVNNLAYALAVQPHAASQAQSQALEEAEGLAESAMGDAVTAPTFLLDTAAWIKFLAGKAAEAHDLLQLATSRRDASPEMWYHFAMVSARTGRVDAARKALENALAGGAAPGQWKVDVEDEIARVQPPG